MILLNKEKAVSGNIHACLFHPVSSAWQDKSAHTQDEFWPVKPFIQLFWYSFSSIRREEVLVT
jgi:hypothetical protein